MSVKLNHHDENYWRKFFESFDKDGDGVLSSGEFIEAIDDSDLPKGLKAAITKSRDCISFDEFYFEISAYQQQNLFMYLLNKWVHFIVPPKHPPLKPGVYQGFNVQK